MMKKEVIKEIEELMTILTMEIRKVATEEAVDKIIEAVAKVEAAEA